MKVTDVSNERNIRWKWTARINKQQKWRRKQKYHQQTMRQEKPNRNNKQQIRNSISATLQKWADNQQESWKRIKRLEQGWETEITEITACHQPGGDNAYCYHLAKNPEVAAATAAGQQKQNGATANLNPASQPLLQPFPSWASPGIEAGCLLERRKWGKRNKVAMDLKKESSNGFKS